MYYLCGENKGADQLYSYSTADLRLCFRICRLLVFLSERYLIRLMEVIGTMFHYIYHRSCDESIYDVSRFGVFRL